MTDGYDPQEHAEQTEAVRSVVREALDRDADWVALAQAGLLGLGIPEEHGGDGLGLVEVGVLLREAGARARHLPLWETLVCGGLVLAGHGTDAQRKEWLPGIAAGEVVLSPALRGLWVREDGEGGARFLVASDFGAEPVDRYGAAVRTCTSHRR